MNSLTTANPAEDALPTPISFRHIDFSLSHLPRRLQCAIELIALIRERSNTDGNEIGGADDGRHSTRAHTRSTLTFWPLLQQFSRIREGLPFGRH